MLPYLRAQRVNVTQGAPMRKGMLPTNGSGNGPGIFRNTNPFHSMVPTERASRDASSVPTITLRMCVCSSVLLVQQQVDTSQVNEWVVVQGCMNH